MAMLTNSENLRHHHCLVFNIDLFILYKNDNNFKDLQIFQKYLFVSFCNSWFAVKILYYLAVVESTVS